MTKQSHFSIALIGIALLLTAFAILVLFTTPTFAGTGALIRVSTVSSVLSGPSHQTTIERRLR